MYWGVITANQGCDEEESQRTNKSYQTRMESPELLQPQWSPIQSPSKKLEPKPSPSLKKAMINNVHVAIMR